MTWNSVANAVLTVIDGKPVANWRQPGRMALALLVSFVVASCVVSPVSDSSRGKTATEARQEAVATSAQKRWDAMIKGDYDTAYDMMSPASRSTISRDQFKARTRHGFTGAKVDPVRCDGDTCRVRVWVTYDLPQIKGMRGSVDEIWIFEHGRPWYVYRE